MKVDYESAFASAWAMFRGDRDVLLALAGVFLFLPTLATLLLVPPAPMRLAEGATTAEIEAASNTLAAWIVNYAPGLMLASVIALFGVTTILCFYLGRGQPDVKGAMAQAAGVFGRVLLLGILISVPAAIGFVLFIVPGLYIVARTMLAGPALIAQGLGPTAALSLSWRVSRGNMIGLFGIACLGVASGQFMAAPFDAIVNAMRAGGAANPIVITLVEALAAAAVTAVSLGWLLLRIAIYRQLAAAPGGGVNPG